MKSAHPGYLLGFAFPIIAIGGYLFQAPWVFLAITVGWLVLMQAFDSFAGHEPAVPWNTVRANVAEPDARLPLENVALYAYVLLHLAAVALGIWQFRRDDAVLPWVLFALPVAMSGSNVLIVAHELLHGSTRLDRWMGRAAAAVSFWMVHEYQHLFVHHRAESFCTENDSSAAKLGQSFYGYFFRAVSDNYRQAGKLAANVLRARGKNLIAARVLAGIYLPPVLLAALVAVFFGGWALLFFLLQAYLTVSLFLLGTYNTHYGLIRWPDADGRPEPYSYMNIWSSDQRATNLAFWSIGRHAHHHLDPFRSYTDLKIIEGSPLLPYGYITTLMLSLIPPLWFKVMNPRVADVCARRERLRAQGFV